jgi:hypothetical protein
MDISLMEKRRAPRLHIPAPATVRKESGEKAAATVVNISSSGVLLELAEPLEIAPGDKVMVDIDLPDDPDRPLPAWGFAQVVRIEGMRLAVELFTAGFHPLQDEPNWPEEL